MGGQRCRCHASAAIATVHSGSATIIQARPLAAERATMAMNDASARTPVKMKPCTRCSVIQRGSTCRRTPSATESAASRFIDGRELYYGTRPSPPSILTALEGRMRLPVISGVLAGALVAAPAAAHHSFAPHFDSSKPVSISGVVTEFEGRNPHSYVHLQAVDENGKTQEYVCESHGVTQLTRNGVTPQILKVGSRIRVTGSLSRHSPYMCFFDSVELADGRVLSVNGPRGGGPAAAAAALPPRKDIFGTWLLAPAPGRSTSGPQPM